MAFFCVYFKELNCYVPLQALRERHPELKKDLKKRGALVRQAARDPVAFLFGFTLEGLMGSGLRVMGLAEEGTVRVLEVYSEDRKPFLQPAPMEYLP